LKKRWKHVTSIVEQAERVEELERQIYGSIQDYEGLYYSYQKAMSMMMRIEQQNKRYRESREKIEEEWEWNFNLNNQEYIGGVCDGLQSAMDIIDEALEGEANGF